MSCRIKLLGISRVLDIKTYLIWKCFDKLLTIRYRASRVFAKG